MTKQQEIDRLTQQVEKLYEVISELRKQADEGFEASPEYQRMKRELLLADKVGDYEERFRREKKAELQLQRELMRLREDNRRMCEENGIEEYRSGMMHDSREDFEFSRLESEILDLKARLLAKDEVISHLKTVLAGEDPEAPRPAIMGKPRIPEETRKRVRKLKRQGWTMSQIADAEGISKSTVHSICHETKKNAKA